MAALFTGTSPDLLYVLLNAVSEERGLQQAPLCI